MASPGRTDAEKLEAAGDAVLAAFPDAVEEPDYVDPVGLYSAAYSPQDREALRRRIEALRGMRVVRRGP